MEPPAQTTEEQPEAEAVETVHVAPVSVLSTEVAEEDEAAAAAAVTAPAPAAEVPAPPAPAAEAEAEAEPAPPPASAEEPDKTRQQRVSDALSRLPTLPTMPSFRLSGVKEARSLACVCAP